MKTNVSFVDFVCVVVFQKCKLIFRLTTSCVFRFSFDDIAARMRVSRKTLVYYTCIDVSVYSHVSWCIELIMLAGNGSVSLEACITSVFLKERDKNPTKLCLFGEQMWERFKSISSMFGVV